MRIGRHSRYWKGCGEISGSQWKKIISDAKRRGIKFKISIRQAWLLFLKQKRRCALSGVILCFPETRAVRYSGTASLDRINSSKGYVRGNIQWIHKDLNRMKATFQQQTFTYWCRMVSENIDGHGKLAKSI